MKSSLIVSSDEEIERAVDGDGERVRELCRWLRGRHRPVPDRLPRHTPTCSPPAGLTLSVLYLLSRRAPCNPCLLRRVYTSTTLSYPPRAAHGGLHQQGTYSFEARHKPLRAGPLMVEYPPLLSFRRLNDCIVAAFALRGMYSHRIHARLVGLHRRCLRRQQFTKYGLSSVCCVSDGPIAISVVHRR